ncbi:hypothetical protein DIZ81_10190 [Legionella taurinensis]|uniref:DUF4189 domain-containing protein n=1 Tax=Legionella taurinensis TaxID=70611 RepID=A0AB38N4Z7_9GAMM|nr:hypothetical protein [Legionella taurinensis]MDX1838302.1 hypothetical protein [Legionella taurinensis]PUT39210.1 hypothetical protein DB744_10200 [Legionella taurinensis]PUT39521.1 hypothetical protein DB746_13585 [Legionella taurinensis]PUT43976.1 hypothetical protein DB743_08920 [Legionella taurinensis]PUT45024.1 hypothetical protein DB745_13525 [Legionella taurinensis]
MKRCLQQAASLALFCVSAASIAQTPTGDNFWLCKAHDQANREWLAQSVYSITAINKAYDACKKQSEYPETCKTSKADCDAFVDGRSTRPMWQCTALDFSGTPWLSDIYTLRDDAALGAKAYCMDNSGIPETCYINMITCRNINAAKP